MRTHFCHENHGALGNYHPSNQAPRAKSVTGAGGEDLLCVVSSLGSPGMGWDDGLWFLWFLDAFRGIGENEVGELDIV